MRGKQRLVYGIVMFYLLLGPACDILPTGVSVYKEDKCFNGYTLLSSFGAHENPPGSGVFHGAILIDMQGRLVNEWAITGFPAKMLPGGHVMGYRNLLRHGHIEADELVVKDWHGNDVWSWNRWQQEEETGGWVCRGHHDFQREGNPVGYYSPGQEARVGSGNTLLLVHNSLGPDEQGIAPWTLNDDAVLEVDHAGNILWQWHAADHIDELGFDAYALEALRTFKVIMPVLLGGGADVSEWLHINDVNRLGPNRWYETYGDPRFKPENIIVDSRNANITWIIDRDSGEIVWKVGPDYSPGNPEYKLGQIIGQHHAHMIPKGLPGEGNILLFDNGGQAGYGERDSEATYPNKSRWYSRVIEFDPVTLDRVWVYRRQVPHEGESYKFFGYMTSGVQRLPNGNTLITEGPTGRVFEVTHAGELVWEYVSPYHDFYASLFPGIPGAEQQNDVYRSYRVPYDYIPEAFRP